MFHPSRRQFLAASSSLACLAGFSNPLGAADADPTAEAITPETQRAIDRGLAWLSKRQLTSGRNKGAFGHGGYEGGVAVCGLSGLAFMCGGCPRGLGP